MIRGGRKIYPVYVVVDIVLIAVSFYVPYLLKYNSFGDIFINPRLPNFYEYTFVFILWAIFLLVSFKRRSLYTTDRGLTIPKEMFKSFIGVFSVSIVISSIIFFAKYRFFSREVFLENCFSLFVLLSGFRAIKRIILRKLVSEGFHNINVLVIGAGRVGKIVLDEIKKVPWWGFRVVGVLDDRKNDDFNGVLVLGKISDFDMVVKKYFVDEAIITIPSEKRIVSQIIEKAKAMHLGVRVVPENFEGPLPLLDINYIGIMPLLTYKERKYHPTELALKRMFDFLVSFALLIAGLPLYCLLAVAIKLDSPGPVFYRQKRAGLKGKPFKVYKFRSMVKDADKFKDQLLEKNEVQDGVIFKMKKDPRITRIGRFLRRYSLDELPQLFNVLKGDMSLVGPRPPTIDEVQKYNYLQMHRLSVRPGITGLSQVKGRSMLTFRRWVKWDLWYVNNWSFGLDLRILWLTLPAVFKGQGAY